VVVLDTDHSTDLSTHFDESSPCSSVSFQVFLQPHYLYRINSPISNTGRRGGVVGVTRQDPIHKLSWPVTPTTPPLRPALLIGEFIRYLFIAETDNRRLDSAPILGDHGQRIGIRRREGLGASHACPTKKKLRRLKKMFHETNCFVTANGSNVGLRE
jgi:hypothetical protein